MRDLIEDIKNKFIKDIAEQKAILVNERIKELGLDGVSFTREHHDSEEYWHEENGVETRIITFVKPDFESEFSSFSNIDYRFIITMKYF